MGCTSSAESTTRKDLTPSSRKDGIACRECGLTFCPSATLRQRKRHTEACVVLRAINSQNDALLVDSVRRLFGPTVGVAENEEIVFPDPPESAGDTVRQFSRVLRSLANFMHSGDLAVTPKTSLRKYTDLSLDPVEQFECFRGLGFEDKQQWFWKQQDCYKVSYVNSWLVIEPQRGDLLYKSFEIIRGLQPAQLHQELQVRFPGEEVQDAGGVAREWFSLLTAELFNPHHGLFLRSDGEEMFYEINPASRCNELHLQYFRFAGRFIGKALFDRRNVAAPLAPHLLRLMVRDVSLGLADLEPVDPVLFRSLQWMRDNDITDVVFETFSCETAFFGDRQTVALIPGGEDIEVSEENKAEFIERRALHRIVGAVREQTDALLAGVADVIPRTLTAVFTAPELGLLLNGEPDIDVSDWQRHSEYDACKERDRVIRWFWEALEEELNLGEKQKLLAFVTGATRPPAGGFRLLQSGRGCFTAFTIQKAPHSPARPQLRAQTCFNRLLLPDFPSKAELVDQLKSVMPWGFGLAE